MFHLNLPPLLQGVTGELVPAPARQLTTRLASLAGNTACLLSISTFHFLQRSLGPAAPFALYGIICLVGCLVLHYFLPETAGPADVDGQVSGSLYKLKQRILCIESMSDDSENEFSHLP